MEPLTLVGARGHFGSVIFRAIHAHLADHEITLLGRTPDPE